MLNAPFTYRVRDPLKRPAGRKNIATLNVLVSNPPDSVLLPTSTCETGGSVLFAFFAPTDMKSIGEFRGVVFC